MSQLIPEIPSDCKSCPHRDFDETPDGENMWSWCQHPSIPKADPYYGRMALDTKYGTDQPPEECPLRKHRCSRE
jgi:hypothetical protein